MVGLSNMSPGASVQTTVEIQNQGSLPFTYTISTSGGATPLWTDPVNGLQMTLKRGSTVVYNGSIQVAPISMGLIVPRGGADSLNLEIKLSPTADNTFQGLSTTITFVWTATAMEQ